ncbi:MAG: hypothetical protein FJZ63_07270, partial [Chlamydiae bacterium]|nr:hypothetical protein [Chlamydiota bacterium]
MDLLTRLQLPKAVQEVLFQKEDRPYYIKPLIVNNFDEIEAFATKQKATLDYTDVIDEGTFFLTGETKPVPLNIGYPKSFCLQLKGLKVDNNHIELDFDDYVKLIANLKTAESIIQYVKSQSIFSDNFMQRSFLNEFPAEIPEQKEQEVHGLLRKIRKMEDSKGCVASYQAKIGNCSELTMIAYAYAQIAHPTTVAEVFKLDIKDHVFLVLGRGSSNPITDWKVSSVVCDPWTQTFYPAFLLHHFLFGYENQAESYNIYGMPMVSAVAPYLNIHKDFQEPDPDDDSYSFKSTGDE